MDFPTLNIDSDKIARECASPHHCKHAKTVLRKKFDKNNKPRLHMQCITCGEPVGLRVSAKGYSDEEITRMEIFDDALRSKSWDDYRRRFDAKRTEEEHRIKAEWNRQYEHYRQTDEWKHKRSKVILRAQGLCEACRDRPATQAHHTTYAHVGREFLFELVAVCEPCHRSMHASIHSRFLKDLFHTAMVFCSTGNESQEGGR